MTRIYVRLSSDSHEGQALRFVTLDESSALNRFETEDEIYAPDYYGEELQIWEDGNYIETYMRSTDKKWFRNYYSNSREEYGTLKIEPHP